MLRKKRVLKKVGELREALRINLKDYNIILMDILPVDFYRIYQAKIEGCYASRHEKIVLPILNK